MAGGNNPNITAVLLANTNTKGSGLTVGNGGDSGQIVTVGSAGKPQRRLTMGLQQQATQPIQCDADSRSNFIDPISPNIINVAKIFFITVTNSGGVSSLTISTGTNVFQVGQTVKFDGLTKRAPTLNGLSAVIVSSSSGNIICTVTEAVIPTASGTETGTMTLTYQGRSAALSLVAGE